MNFYRKVTCSPGCASALREDRRLGLVYGPYAKLNAEGKPIKFLSMLEWVAYADECAYCRGDLPRGRAARIQAELDAEELRREQESNYNADIAASLRKV